MFQERELMPLVVIGALTVFILINRKKIRLVPEFHWLAGAFFAHAASLTFSVLEDFALANFFNLLQHACAALTAILLAVWCWLVLARRREKTA